MMVNGGYLFLGFVAIFTLFLKAYKVFFYISELLMALLYLSLGSVIVYFGKKASEIFRSKSQNNFDNNETDKKLGFMSFSIGGLFVLKGVSGVLGGIGAYDPGNHNVYDFFWFLVLEVLPTVIFIYIAKKKDFNNNPDTPRSTFNEMDSINNSSQEITSYRPPFEKE